MFRVWLKERENYLNLWLPAFSQGNVSAHFSNYQTIVSSDFKMILTEKDFLAIVQLYSVFKFEPNF